MRPSEVARNIHQAKSELERLKNEMSFLSAADDSAIDDYAGIMHYSIGKFEQAIGIGKQKEQARPQLPLIGSTRSRSRASIRGKDEQSSQLPPNRAYKRLRRAIKGVGHKSLVHNNNDSTALDTTTRQRPSLTIVNKPLRMLSFVEKNVRPEYQTNIPPAGYRLDFPMSMKELDPKDFYQKQQPRQPQLKLYNMQLRHSQYKTESRPVSNITDTKEPQGERPQFQFMLQNGRADMQTAEFGSYRRIYQSIWKKLKMLFERLEEVLSKHKIELACVDGKRLTVLALRPTATVEDLISCLVDNHKYRMLVLPKSNYVGVEGKLLAILKIQRFWRMYTIRKQYLSFRRSVVKAQLFLKKFISKIRTRRQIHQRNDQMHQSFMKRQKQLAVEWQQLSSGHRVELHVNSFAVDQIKRITVSNLTEKKNLQLTRIFRLKDPKLTIVMVLPNDMPVEVLNYYYRVLELAGVPEYRDRLHFVTPEAIQHFPEHMSTTKLLYYSPKCLQKIRRIVKQRPCLMISGYPCNESIKICDLLNIYLLSGDPQKCKYFSTKSQARRLFVGADLPVPPGAIELYDVAEFVNTLAVLIANNRQIHTWVVKIDDQFGGRGSATLNVHKIRAIRKLLSQKEYEEVEEPVNQLFPTVVPIEQQADFHEQLTSQIKAILETQLPRRLVIGCPNLYKNYTEFMCRMVVKGGCIEAYPLLRNEDIKSCSVSFFNSPTGQLDIICSYEKIVAGMQPVGCSFPQTALTYNTVYNSCKSLSEALQLRGMFGYFTVDFIAFKEVKETYYRSWAIGLDCYLNTDTCSFFYFDLLMNGKFLVEEGQYLVDQPSPIQPAKNRLSSVKEGKDLQHSADTLATLPRPTMGERSYIFIPYIHNQHLNTVKMKTFFKMARLENISYDLQEKRGICMLLVDQLSSGVLGLLSIHRNLEENVEELYRAVSFVGRQAKTPTVRYGTSDTSSRSDEQAFRDIISKLNSLRRKFGRLNFREQALKRNMIHCNLQEV